MLASAGACAWHSGLAELLFGHCARLSDLGPLSVYRPWVAAQYAGVLGARPVSYIFTMWSFLRHSCHPLIHHRSLAQSRRQG